MKYVVFQFLEFVTQKTDKKINNQSSFKRNYALKVKNAYTVCSCIYKIIAN